MTNKQSLLAKLRELTGEDTVVSALESVRIIEQRRSLGVELMTTDDQWKQSKGDIMSIIFEIFGEETLRKQLTPRGGGVEISLASFGFDGHKMSAYQNHLGGGMLGSIQANDTVRHANDTKSEVMYSSELWKLDLLSEALKRYMHSLTNPDDEWDGMEFEKRQSLPSSAY